jgi:hypothetical protein
MTRDERINNKLLRGIEPRPLITNPHLREPFVSAFKYVMERLCDYGFEKAMTANYLICDPRFSRGICGQVYYKGFVGPLVVLYESAFESVGRLEFVIAHECSHLITPDEEEADNWVRSWGLGAYLKEYGQSPY